MLFCLTFLLKYYMFLLLVWKVITVSQLLLFMVSTLSLFGDPYGMTCGGGVLTLHGWFLVILIRCFLRRINTMELLFPNMRLQTLGIVAQTWGLQI
jgi:hypothetical protein